VTRADRARGGPRTMCAMVTLASPRGASRRRAAILIVPRRRSRLMVGIHKGYAQSKEQETRRIKQRIKQTFA